MDSLPSGGNSGTRLKTLPLSFESQMLLLDTNQKLHFITIAWASLPAHLDVYEKIFDV